MNPSDIKIKSQSFETADAEEIVSWAFREYGKSLVATSSFQTQSLPLLDILGKRAPGIDVIFLDTGFHFPETLSYLDRLRSRFDLNIKSVTYPGGHASFLKSYPELHKSDPDKCCYLNKVAPLRTALRDYKAWITGIRRDQSPTRRETPILLPDAGNLLKICPMVHWTHERVLNYVQEHDLPIHPLFYDGYLSIGCAPCTCPVKDSDDPRLGRWKNLAKTECGLHPVPPPAVIPIKSKDKK